MPLVIAFRQDLHRAPVSSLCFAVNCCCFTCTIHDVDFLLAIAVRFGGDVTLYAIENRFKRIKKDAQLINDSIAKGIDPMDLEIGGANNDAVRVRTPCAKRDAGQTRQFHHFQALFTFPSHSI